MGLPFSSSWVSLLNDALGVEKRPPPWATGCLLVDDDIASLLMLLESRRLTFSRVYSFLCGITLLWSHVHYPTNFAGNFEASKADGESPSHCEEASHYRLQCSSYVVRWVSKRVPFPCTHKCIALYEEVPPSLFIIMPTLPVGQYPFVNVFKQFGVGQWKRCCKEGDVTPVMVTILCMHCNVCIYF